MYTNCALECGSSNITSFGSFKWNTPPALLYIFKWTKGRRQYHATNGVWEQLASNISSPLRGLQHLYTLRLVNLKAINRNYQKSVCECKWKIFWKCNQNNLKLCTFLYFMQTDESDHQEHHFFIQVLCWETFMCIFYCQQLILLIHFLKYDYQRSIDSIINRKRGS